MMHEYIPLSESNRVLRYNSTAISIETLRELILVLGFTKNKPAILYFDRRKEGIASRRCCFRDRERNPIDLWPTFVEFSKDNRDMYTFISIDKSLANSDVNYFFEPQSQIKYIYEYSNNLGYYPFPDFELSVPSPIMVSLFKIEFNNHRLTFTRFDLDRTHKGNNQIEAFKTALQEAIN